MTQKERRQVGAVLRMDNPAVSAAKLRRKMEKATEEHSRNHPQIPGTHVTSEQFNKSVGGRAVRGGGGPDDVILPDGDRS